MASITRYTTKNIRYRFSTVVLPVKKRRKIKDVTRTVGGNHYYFTVPMGYRHACTSADNTVTGSFLFVVGTVMWDGSGIESRP